MKTPYCHSHCMSLLSLQPCLNTVPMHNKYPKVYLGVCWSFIACRREIQYHDFQCKLIL